MTWGMTSWSALKRRGFIHLKTNYVYEMNSRPICGELPQPVCPNSKWNVDESKDTQTANGGQEVGLAGISFFGPIKV